MARRYLGLAGWVLAVLMVGTSPAVAQSADADDDAGELATRPATTTFLGDTGLWFVPTGEILPDRKVSVSIGRIGFNREQGFTNVSHFPITFGVGIRDRVELFGSFRTVTRIDRDVRPIFGADGSEFGGLTNDDPLMTTGWGSGVGDLLIGAKVNLTSEHRQQGAAFAIRAVAQLPTGDTDEGIGTGEPSFELDAIVSNHVNGRVELSGFGGFAMRGDPDGSTLCAANSPCGINLSNGFRWGVGAGFSTSNAVRLFTELHGEATFDDVTVETPFAAEDGTLSPLLSPTSGPLDATIGVLWQASSGFFAGAGLNIALNHGSRSDAGQDSASGDKMDFLVRLGYHPGVRVYVLPPPPPPPPPSNQPPTVTARCNPCTVNVGERSELTSQAQDPDGDALSYRWSAGSGSFADPTAPDTAWTAPDDEGAVPIAVAVTDGRGGEASDTVTVEVVRPAVREFVFEDVHFDFDRYSLRPSAVRVLDEAIAALEETPTLQIEIEGHTCNIGTAEYNLALGDRRAQAVLDYLTSRGIGAGRLRTVSYGEERPAHDNSREETRRLNRRAAMVVRVQ
ncbi:MAG: OmpA family protein [Vicinamibacterales bacterium]|nr:OmpA family protein [Vicinamibacterales bacterium]